MSPCNGIGLSRSAIWLPRALLIGLLVASPVPAAAQSGVLLGLHTGQGYRTLWIATDGDSVALLAAGPDLLVPRADGFWRVGVVELDERTNQLAIGPASLWTTLVDSERSADSPPEDEECQPSRRVEILFLGSNHLTTREGLWQSEECSLSGRAHGGDHYAEYTLDDATAPLRELVDSTALAEALRSAPDSARRADALANPEASAGERRRLEECDYGNATWHVRRSPGRWEIAIEVPAASPEWQWAVCNGHAFALPAPLPGEVVGHDALLPDLQGISLVFPNVRDAVSSPGHDLLVALTADTVYAARIEDGRIQGPGLALPVGGRVVMAQWALGRHVRRWTDEVRPLLGDGRMMGVPSPTPRPYSQSVATRVLALGADGARRETGDAVLVGQPAVIGFDWRSADSTLSVEETRIDDRAFQVMPDTARVGIRLDLLLVPRFVPFGAGRYTVTAQLGPPRAWERLAPGYDMGAWVGAIPRPLVRLRGVGAVDTPSGPGERGRHTHPARDARGHAEAALLPCQPRGAAGAVPGHRSGAAPHGDRGPRSRSDGNLRVRRQSPTGGVLLLRPSAVCTGRQLCPGAGIDSGLRPGGASQPRFWS